MVRFGFQKMSMCVIHHCGKCPCQSRQDQTGNECCGGGERQERHGESSQQKDWPMNYPGVQCSGWNARARRRVVGRCATEGFGFRETMVN